MAKQELSKYEFKSEYPIPPDIRKDKIRFDKFDSGYSINYEDEREYKDGDLKGFSSYSMSFSESYGKKIQNIEMEVNDDIIRVVGNFEPQE